MNNTRPPVRHIVVWTVCGLLPIVTMCCSLFDPREAEEPSQSGLAFRPPTDASIVIANLQSAIDQKNLANYVSCFADPAKTTIPFTYIASGEALAQFPTILEHWTIDDEHDYFQNMMARTPTSAYSNLSLSLRSSSTTADSVTLNYDYVLIVEHSDAGVSRTASGNLQFTLGTDKTNFWMIYRWIDFKTTSDITWSTFKGRFSN